MTKHAPETWKPVSTFEGIYEVSDHGRVRSLDRYVRHVDRLGTESLRLRRGIVLTPAQHNHGYRVVALVGDGKKEQWLIHRLVAIHFLPPEAGKNCVNHLDADKTNNAVWNLEWCSYAENTAHAVKHDLMNCPKGSKKGAAKLTESDIPIIRAMIAEGIQNTVIADMFGVAQPQISYIKTGKAWRHVP